MGTIIRAFNDAGIEQFRTALRSIKANTIQNLPENLIDDPELSQPVSGDVEVDNDKFKSKLDAAHYLLLKINELNLPNKFYNSGLWAWLSAFYFDSVCPLEKTGRRKPREDYRHIPEKKLNFYNYYRHLIAGPVRVYALYGDVPCILLSGPLHIMGDYVEQLASRQEIAMNYGVLEAANTLYWDTNELRPKVGAAPNWHKPGTLRRFVDLISQLDPTYDLQGMTSAQVLELLPDEFRKWKF